MLKVKNLFPSVLLALAAISSVTVAYISASGIDSTSFFTRNRWNYCGTTENSYTETTVSNHATYCQVSGSSEDVYTVRAVGSYHSRYNPDINVYGYVRVQWKDRDGNITSDSNRIGGTGTSQAEASFINGWYSLDGHYAETNHGVL